MAIDGIAVDTRHTVAVVITSDGSGVWAADAVVDVGDVEGGARNVIEAELLVTLSSLEMVKVLL